jgi:hypothetical protein
MADGEEARGARMARAREKFAAVAAIVNSPKLLSQIADDLRAFIRTAPGAEKDEAISKLREVENEIAFRAGGRTKFGDNRSASDVGKVIRPDDEAARLIADFARALRRLTPDGRIPASWKKRTMQALAKPRGLIPRPDRVWFLARAEFNRGLREERQKARLKSGRPLARRARKVPSQKQLAQKLGTTPKTLQRASKKHAAKLWGQEVARRRGIKDRKARKQRRRELKDWESDKK